MSSSALINGTFRDSLSIKNNKLLRRMPHIAYTIYIYMYIHFKTRSIFPHSKSPEDWTDKYLNNKRYVNLFTPLYLLYILSSISYITFNWSFPLVSYPSLVSITEFTFRKYVLIFISFVSRLYVVFWIFIFKMEIFLWKFIVLLFFWKYRVASG